MSLIVVYYATPESDAAVSLGVRHCLASQTRLITMIATRHGRGVELAVEEEAEDRLLRSLVDSGVEFEIRRSRGDIGIVEQVLATVTEVGAQGIVLGLRSGGSGQAVLGQTATQLLLESPVPVVTTRVQAPTA